MSRALYGAWRLARFDQHGLSFFNISKTGFWNSFHAAALIAPFYALLLGLRYLYGLEQAPLYRLIPIEAISYVFAWIIFPLVMFYITRWLDKPNQYIRLIVVYNWASVLQNVLYLPIAIIGVLGVFPEEVTNGLGMIVFIMVLLYVGFIISITLEQPPLIAAGIVVLDFMLAIFINDISRALLKAV